MSPSKSVLITGCSDDGIGSATALEFQKKGFLVFATARNLNKAAKLKNIENIKLLQLDVTDPDQINAAAAEVQAKTGGTLDVLVNNAGRNHFMPLLDEDIQVAKKIFDTNVWGTLAVTQAFAPFLIRAKGKCVFISSVSGYLNVPYMGSYAGSKRTMEIMAETLRLELAPFDVKVLSVVTGAVRTQGQTYLREFHLPESSLYKSIEPTIAARARGDDGVIREPVAEYSKKVVAQIIGGTTGHFWCGARAGVIKFGVTWLPTSVMEKGLLQGMDLDKLPAI